MNILLTGATGFLGSHLLEKLLDSEHNIIILKRSFSDDWRISKLLSRLRYYDVDKIHLKKVFKDNKIDMIIHTATVYGRKEEKIHEMINANITFPLSLLEIGKTFNVKYFINTDTYFNTKVKFSDNLKVYVNTKKDFIKYSKEIIEDSKIKFLNVKLEHLFGEKDNSSKFIPFLINKMIKNQPIDLTKCEQRRDFIYIDDAVNAYLTIVRNIEKIEPKNNICFIELGTGSATDLKSFVELTKKIVGSQSKLNFGAIPYRKDEIMESRADINFLRRLGWKANIGVEDAISRTARYYKRESLK